MGKLRTALVVGLLAGATLTAEAQTETQLGDIYSRASSAMVVLKCAFRGQQANRSITGQAVCIDKAGTFLTFALDNRVRPEHIVRCRIVVPGHAGRNVAAKLLWTDAETGMAFIQASEAHNWSAVKFVRNANLAVGQKVFSVGLMPNDPSHAPCVAVAYVSAVLRVPELLVYVTGGKLTGVGSPVFTADGRAVGLVGRQPFLSHQLAANRKFTEVGLKNRQESAFFTPADEFAHVLEHPGRRKLPWFGALSVQGVGFTPEDA